MLLDNGFWEFKFELDRGSERAIQSVGAEKQLRRTHLMWQQTNNKKRLRDGKCAKSVNILILFFCPWTEYRQLTGWICNDVWALPSPPLHSNCRHTNTLHCVCMYTIWMICPLPVKISTWYLLVEAGYDAEKKQKQRLSRLLTPGKKWQKCAVHTFVNFYLCTVFDHSTPRSLCLWQCSFL